MGLEHEVRVETTAYTCDNVSCDVVVPAASVFDEDKPEGYFVTLERVTQSHNHYRTPREMFFHDKDCLINFFEYGISHGTIPWQPIGKAPSRWH